MTLLPIRELRFAMIQFQVGLLRSISRVLLLVVISAGQLYAQDQVIGEGNAEEIVVPDPIEFRSLKDVQKEIQQASSLPGGESLLERQDENVQVWIPQIFMGLDNAYSDEQIRYLSARVTILNRTNAPITLETSKIILKGWGESYKLSSSSPESNLMPVRVGRDSYSMKELRTPEGITIPTKKAVSFWVVYTDLDKANVIGNLQLEVPLADDKFLQHDLRKEQKARLGFEAERIGPADSLALITIHGALNSINAQDLADNLRQLKKQKVERAVMSWDDQSSATIDDLVDWILHRAAQDLQNELYVQFPPLETFKFLAVANLPKPNAEAGFDDQMEAFIYESTEAAALAAFGELFELIPAKYITREIREGHPFSQRAALAALEVRQDRSLNENLFPLLSQIYDTANEETRPFVLLAIGQQDHPQAIQMLKKIAAMEREKDAEAAFTALVKSNQPAAIPAIMSIIKDDQFSISREKQVRILSANFRREWTEFLVEALEDQPAEVRAAAMEGFVHVGHPNLNIILQRGLEDSSKSVRDTAFAALVEKTDRQSEMVAVDYALKLLESGDISENVLLIIKRTRDQRAAPVVLKLFEEKPRIRSGLISLLKEIGDQTSVRNLLKEIDQYTPSEQVAIYQLAILFNLPEQFELSQQAIQSKESEVRQMGLQMLTQLASDESTHEIAKLLDSEDESQMTQACYALGRVGTKRAEELLKEFRLKSYQAGDENGLKSAGIGIRLWMNHSPGWNAMESAYYHSNVDNYENALVYFDLATEIDPDLGVAYSGKGNSLLRLDRHDEALKAFQKAYDMDSFDGQAVTGIGIVKAIQGDTEEAVGLTLESSDKFPKDNIYAYNTACVYGRAIEYLKKEAPEENSEVIQQYGVQAIQALKDSIEYGFDEFTLMRTDPDIDSLRSLPGFKELLKNQL